MMTLPNKCSIFQEDLKEKAASPAKDGLFVYWLPFVNSFRTFITAPSSEIQATFEAIHLFDLV